MRRQDPVPESIAPEIFIASAALECMTDAQLGRLAMDRGDAESLRHFAHAMLDVYEKGTADIARIAARKGLPIPRFAGRGTPAICRTDAAEKRTDFDLAYTGGIIERHENAITLFKRGQRIKDPEISALASRTLSMLEARIARPLRCCENMARPTSPGPRLPASFLAAQFRDFRRGQVRSLGAEARGHIVRDAGDFRIRISAAECRHVVRIAGGSAAGRRR